MGDAFTEGGGGGVVGVKVQGVVVSRDRGKRFDLLIGDESRIGSGITIAISSKVILLICILVLPRCYRICFRCRFLATHFEVVRVL